MDGSTTRNEVARGMRVRDSHIPLRIEIVGMTKARKERRPFAVGLRDRSRLAARRVTALRAFPRCRHPLDPPLVVVEYGAELPLFRHGDV